ncbi:unnamed protein product [Nezara viridula]|uniref:Condensin complex subunit 2 n=1 Tax=Nezara viridula TaxID=85310 RepID=A0A9P0HTH9_NEZVI|nr:unnamed protein product [Nezara viridula]
MVVRGPGDFAFVVVFVGPGARRLPYSGGPIRPIKGGGLRLWIAHGPMKKETHEKPVKFSEIYSSLPDKLPKEEAAELSFPLAFMALLHMANEKNLALKGTNDYDDIYVSLD